MKDETKYIHAGYEPRNGDPRQLPIVQSTTYTYDSSDAIAAVFDEPTHALIYSRFANPTVMAVEKKIAALEGGAAAMATSSGQAATLMSILNLCSAGDSFVSSSEVYGGTANLFSVTLKKLGIEVIYIDPDAPADELAAAFKDNTKALFGEMIANPSMSVLDVEKFARVAHAAGVPLIVDLTSLRRCCASQSSSVRTSLFTRRQNTWTGMPCRWAASLLTPENLTTEMASSPISLSPTRPITASSTRRITRPPLTLLRPACSFNAISAHTRRHSRRLC